MHKFALRREILTEAARVVIGAVVRALINELVSWLL
jgi:large-conductance mechanosensitive channel